MRQLLAVVFAFLVSSVAWAVDAFELQQMNGENIGQMYRSVDHEDAVFVFEAYFNLCPYCHENAPLVKRLAEEFKDEPRVQVIDLGRDCRDSDYRSWISRHQPKHPVLKDCNRVVLSQLNVSAFPTTAVIDCKGRERLRNVGTFGGSNASYSQVVAKIRELLNEPCN
jgi:peroxiredoxin